MASLIPDPSNDAILDHDHGGDDDNDNDDDDNDNDNEHREDASLLTTVAPSSISASPSSSSDCEPGNDNVPTPAIFAPLSLTPRASSPSPSSPLSSPRHEHKCTVIPITTTHSLSSTHTPLDSRHNSIHDTIMMNHGEEGIPSSSSSSLSHSQPSSMFPSPLTSSSSSLSSSFGPLQHHHASVSSSSSPRGSLTQPSSLSYYTPPPPPPVLTHGHGYDDDNDLVDALPLCMMTSTNGNGSDGTYISHGHVCIEGDSTARWSCGNDNDRKLSNAPQASPAVAASASAPASNGAAVSNSMAVTGDPINTYDTGDDDYDEDDVVDAVMPLRGNNNNNNNNNDAIELARLGIGLPAAPMPVNAPRLANSPPVAMAPNRDGAAAGIAPVVTPVLLVPPSRVNGNASSVIAAVVAVAAANPAEGSPRRQSGVAGGGGAMAPQADQQRQQQRQRRRRRHRHGLNGMSGRDEQHDKVYHLRRAAAARVHATMNRVQAQWAKRASDGDGVHHTDAGASPSFLHLFALVIGVISLIVPALAVDIWWMKLSTPAEELLHPGCGWVLGRCTQYGVKCNADWSIMTPPMISPEDTAMFNQCFDAGAHLLSSSLIACFLCLAAWITMTASVIATKCHHRGCYSRIDQCSSRMSYRWQRPVFAASLVIYTIGSIIAISGLDTYRRDCSAGTSADGFEPSWQRAGVSMYLFLAGTLFCLLSAWSTLCSFFIDHSLSLNLSIGVIASLILSIMINPYCLVLGAVAYGGMVWEARQSRLLQYLHQVMPLNRAKAYFLSQQRALPRVWMSVECYHLAHVASSRRVISLRRSQHVLAAVRDLTIAPSAIMNHQPQAGGAVGAAAMNGVLVHEQHVEGRPNHMNGHDRNGALPHRLDDDDDDDDDNEPHANHTWLHRCCRHDDGDKDDDGDDDDYDASAYGDAPSSRWCRSVSSPHMWRLRLDKMFVFADDTAAQRYNAARAAFVSRHGNHDTRISYSEGMTIGEYRDQLLIHDYAHVPYWLTPSMYWCMTLLLLSYPYRVWLTYQCPLYTMHVIKELRNVSVQDQQAPPLAPIAAPLVIVPAAAAAPLSAAPPPPAAAAMPMSPLPSVHT